MMPAVGKSGAGMISISSSMLISGLVEQGEAAASTTSFRLCGGMLVAMPTAMPDEPLISRLGIRAGSTSGSMFRTIVVGPEIDRFLVEVGEQLVADARHAGTSV